MTTLRKTLYNVIKKYKAASLFTILGLSVALATTLIIAMQAHYEFGYNKNISKYDRICRTYMKWTDGSDVAVMSAGFANAVKEESLRYE